MAATRYAVGTRLFDLITNAKSSREVQLDPGRPSSGSAQMTLQRHNRKSPLWVYNHPLLKPLPDYVQTEDRLLNGNFGSKAFLGSNVSVYFPRATLKYLLNPYSW